MAGDGMMEIIPQLASIPMGIMNDAGQQFANLMAMYQNQQRYDQALNENKNLEGWAQGRAYDVGAEGDKRLADMGAANQGAWNDFAGKTDAGYGDIDKTSRREFTALRDRVVGDYQNRYNRNMGYLEGAGAQEKKDINTSFDNRGAANLQDMVGRGLTGSTILPGMQSANERYRSDALGGLQERLNQQRLATDSSLSGDTINADRTMSAGIQENAQGLALDQLNNRTNMGTTGYNIGAGNLMNRYGNWGAQEGQITNAGERYGGNRINIITGREDVYPNENLFAQTMGQSGSALAPYPEAPEANTDSGLMTGLIGGGAAAGGAGLGYYLASAGTAKAMTLMFTCIAEPCHVSTADRPKRLADVEIGDEVFTPDGFHKVLWKDHGFVPEDRRERTIQVMVEGGKYVVLTESHFVNGRPAKDLQVGDALETYNGPEIISSIFDVDYVPSCDLLIDGADQYYVDSILVDSMISKILGDGGSDAEIIRQKAINQGVTL